MKRCKPVRAASAGGADRIELCAALSEGGVTASLSFLREAVLTSLIPVHALIRPRGGGFVYSDAEFRIVCADLVDALSAGAAGIVVGVLTPDRRVDRERARELMRLADGKPVTFHRAFDRTADLLQSLAVLLDLGYDRILTSGGEPTVSEGYDTLLRLTLAAAGRIRIAAGGGVTLANATQFVRMNGLDLHASLRPKTHLSPSGDPLWSEETENANISVEAVRALSNIVHSAQEEHWLSAKPQRGLSSL